MLWTELLFSYFPIDENVFWQQMLARLGFLFAFWLVGLVLHVFDGLMTVYLSALNLYVTIFGTLFVILYGSYYVQRTLIGVTRNFRPILKLDDVEFQEFSERLEHYVYSFLPCLFIAIAFGIFLSDVPSQLQQLLVEGLRLYAVWNLLASSLGSLLVGTAIWMFVSIWLTIFLMSRQPLNVKLSPETITRFRELSMFALWFSLFYFIGISIGNISIITNVFAISFLEMLTSPLLFFIAVGIVGILFPFYNIHLALLRLKKRELRDISEESELLLQQLDEVLAKKPSRESSAQTISIMAHLFSLQMRERNTQAAQEWPIDVSFVSKLIVLGLIPIISRVVASLILS